MEPIILICLNNFFIFHLINGGHSMGKIITANILPLLNHKVRYALECSFCSGFWFGAAQWGILTMNFSIFGLVANIGPLWIPAFAVVNYFSVSLSDFLREK